MTATSAVLTSRWVPMKMHPTRQRFLASPRRHRVVAAGRRSGKTEDAKRIIIAGDIHHACCLVPPAGVPNARYGVAAPTREQVKRVWWEDVKRLSPPWAVRAIREDELVIRYVTGASLHLIGLDKPQRAEGDPFDGLVVDETQEIKPSAWLSSLRPTLSNRGRPPGWSLRIGRPKLRNHFFDWFEEGLGGRSPDVESFTWTSAEVLPREEIEAARRDLDPRTFAQEYEAAFLSQSGLVYYGFAHAKHCRAVRYDPRLPLAFSLDFNVAPGSAVVLQEQELPPWDAPKGRPHVHTCVVGEVHIPDDSMTSLVCDRLAADYRGHVGPVLIYGDPAGNQRSTKSESNDWQIVLQHLRKTFRDVRLLVARSSPSVVDSVNATNSRMESATGLVRFAINPETAKQTLRDLESVSWDATKSDRQIDKRDLKRTHWSDAVRYYVNERHPIGGGMQIQ